MADAEAPEEEGGDQEQGGGRGGGPAEPGRRAEGVGAAEQRCHRKVGDGADRDDVEQEAAQEAAVDGDGGSCRRPPRRW